MNKRTISQRIRTTVLSTIDTLGCGAILRQAYVEMNLLGERAKFMIHGRPAPSTAIVLAGSGRSGTTWLQNALCTLPGVQPIFEPLHPRFNRDVQRLTGCSMPDAYIYVYGWYLSPDAENPAWTMALKRILTGLHRNYWTDYERVSYFPKHYLVKLIRANMMLGYLYQRFQPRLIYLIRHPCAVVSSRLAAGWRANVQDILCQASLVRDYYLGDQEKLLHEKDQIGAHAVWWAIENHVALQQLRKLPHFLVYYEELVLDPKKVLDSLFLWLGHGTPTNDLENVLAQPSRVSSGIVHNRDAQDRLSSWKSRLSVADCQRVLGWAHQFGLRIYDEQPLPIHLRLPN